MLKKHLKKYRNWLAKLLIITIALQGLLLAASVSTYALYFPEGGYIDNFNVTPSEFNPNVESTEVSFDLLQDADMHVYVIDADDNIQAIFVDYMLTFAGSISYTWYGTIGNTPGGEALPEGEYTVMAEAIVDTNVQETVTQVVTISIPIPVPSTYTIDIDELTDAVVGEENTVNIEIANEEPPGDMGYNDVMVRLIVDSAPGEFDLMVESPDDGALYDFVEDLYYGPTVGFSMDAVYSNTIPVAATFYAVGDYTITLELIDIENGEEIVVLATTTTTYTVVVAPPPSPSTYTIDLTDLESTLINVDYDVDIVVVNEEPPGDMGYDDVMIRLTVDSAPGEFDLMVESPDDGALYDLVEDLYYGPTVGFSMDAVYSNTIPIIATFYTAGDYAITLDLMDMDNEEPVVVATTTKTYAVALEEPLPPPPSGGGGGGGILPKYKNPDTNQEEPEEEPEPEGEGETILLQASDDIADPFCDTEDHWAEEFIDELRLMGIVSGRGECEFEPESPLTRAEATKISLGVFGIDLLSETVEEKPFPDVDIDQWYAPYLATGKEYSVVSGYGDGLFRPEQTVTRAEALRIILEASGVSITEGELSYSDMETYAWYRKYVSTGTELGLVEGYSDGTFKPYQSITRAEFAKLAILMLEMT